MHSHCSSALPWASMVTKLLLKYDFIIPLKLFVCKKLSICCDIEVAPSWAAARGRCSPIAWNQTPGDGSAPPRHNEDVVQVCETPAAWIQKTQI